MSKEELSKVEEEDEWAEDEVIPISEFKTLDLKKLPKNRKVDWDGVLSDILKIGKPFGTPLIRELANKHSVSGEPVSLYYSEIERVLDKWGRDETLIFSKRTRTRDRRNFFYILKKPM